MNENKTARQTGRERIGFAMCGSFCTHAEAIRQLELLSQSGAALVPIMSETAYGTDTRFGTAEALRERVRTVCGAEIVHTIAKAEPLGPKAPLDLLILCPCTGNTLAKIAHGVTDTAVCMAVKAHLRADRCLVIALASNDGMSANLANLSVLLARKQVYFVPMRQDDPIAKPHSLVADFSLLGETVAAAREGRQLRPLFR